jgi:hypothetical protein
MTTKKPNELIAIRLPQEVATVRPLVWVFGLKPVLERSDIELCAWAGVAARMVLGVCLLLAPAALPAQVVVSGTVTDQFKRPVASAHIAIEAENAGSVFESHSNETGAFSFNLDRSGFHFLTVSLPGFLEVKRKPIDLIVGLNFLSVELIPAEAPGISMDVYPEGDVAVEQIPFSETLTDRQIDSIPATRSYQLTNMLALFPGAVKDSKSRLHFHGSASEEVNWVLDGFSVSDPSSAQFELDLGVEAVRSVDLFSGRYSVEFGKGTGGTVLMNTGMGTNTFKQQVTNFVPAFEVSKGLQLDSWRPRYTVSGPIVRDRLWFFSSLDLNFRQNLIVELPRGQDQTASLAAQNLFRVQAHLAPNHTVSSGFVVNYFNAPNTGLSPLDPVETTLDRRARRYFFSIKDQVTLSSRSLLEFGYAAYRSINRELPQGQGLYVITPFGRRGHFAVNSLRQGSRDQALVNAFLPPIDFAGSHQFKLGLVVNHSRYSQDVQRTGYEYYRLAGTRLSRVTFGGTGRFRRSNLEAGAYWQDRWAIKPWLGVEAGVRWDWDAILSRSVITPRFGFAVMPPGLRGTKLSAGYGVIPAATYLRLFSRDLDQYPIATRYAMDGETIIDGSWVRIFTVDRSTLTIPTIRSLSLGLEQALPGHVQFAVNYLRKRGHNGYTFQPASSAATSLELSEFPTHRIDCWQLSNSRLEMYDSVEVALSKRWLGEHDWALSYMRSRAYSNSALDISADDPIVFSSTAGRLPWDVPNRLVSWGSLPISRRLTFFYLLEWRDGLPFSVHDDEGLQVGSFNNWRLPRFFSLNTHVEGKVSLFGQRWALRPGVDNVTNHPNYSLVNENTASPDFLYYYGRQPRKFVVRVRWLGKAPR